MRHDASISEVFVLKKIAIVLVVVVVGVLGVIMTRPSTFHAERSAVVNAPVDVVFADVNTLGDNGFIKWSPWEKRDPAMKKQFAGPPAGVGNSYHWEGNKDVGSGTMTIKESKPNEMVKSDLEFTAPNPSKADVTMTLVKQGDTQTKVTWSMDGDGGFSGKVLNTFTSMDKIIGPDFEAGLKNLQQVAELDAKKSQDEAAKKAAEAAAATPPATEGAAPAAPTTTPPSATPTNATATPAKG